MARADLRRRGVYSPNEVELFHARTAALRRYESDVADTLKAARS
jgi:hypothetical protein